MGRLRILHVNYNLQLDGIQQWLANVFRLSDRTLFDHHLMIFSQGPEALEPEMRALAIDPIRIPIPHRFWSHNPRFRRAIREHGPFDIIHSHVLFTGIILRQARYAGIPIRIAHSHNDAAYFRPSGWFGMKSAVLQLTNGWIRRDATLGLAHGCESAVGMYGPHWNLDPRWQVYYQGTDLDRFRDPVDRLAVRRELGVAPDAPMVVHIGRFAAQKNHAYLVRIAAEVVRRRPETRFVLVGIGPLHDAVRAQVVAAGLDRNTIFTGVRKDAPQILASADVLLFPSVYEGLCNVVIEAQAAGLPGVISDSITREADVIPELIRRLPLSASPVEWADAVCGTIAAGPAITRSEAFQRMEISPFNIRTALRILEDIYLTVSSARRQHECGG